MNKVYDKYLTSRYLAKDAYTNKFETIGDYAITKWIDDKADTYLADNSLFTCKALYGDSLSKPVFQKMLKAADLNRGLPIMAFYPPQILHSMINAEEPECFRLGLDNQYGLNSDIDMMLTDIMEQTENHTQRLLDMQPDNHVHNFWNLFYKVALEISIGDEYLELYLPNQIYQEIFELCHIVCTAKHSNEYKEKYDRMKVKEFIPCGYFDAWYDAFDAFREWICSRNDCNTYENDLMLIEHVKHEWFRYIKGSLYEQQFFGVRKKYGGESKNDYYVNNIRPLTSGHALWVLIMNIFYGLNIDNNLFQFEQHFIENKKLQYDALIGAIFNDIYCCNKELEGVKQYEYFGQKYGDLYADDPVYAEIIDNTLKINRNKYEYLKSFDYNHDVHIEILQQQKNAMNPLKEIINNYCFSDDDLWNLVKLYYHQEISKISGYGVITWQLHAPRYAPHLNQNLNVSKNI